MVELKISKIENGFFCGITVRALAKVWLQECKMGVLSEQPVEGNTFNFQT